MAIDPSIALGYKPPQIDMLGTAQKGMQIAQMAQSIEASKASQAISEAQLPGVQADSATKVRANEYVDWLKNNKKDFTDPDGNVNTLKLTAASTAAGYGDSAQPIAANDLTMAGQKIANATSQQEQNIAKANYMNTAAGHTANLISDPALSDDQAGALVAKSVEFANKQVPGSGDQIAKLLTTTVPVKGPNGEPLYQTDPVTKQPVLDAQGQPVPLTKTVVDRAAAKEVARATQDMNTQFQNAQAKQRQDAALELSSQTPEGRATTGPQINAAYAALRAAGIGPDKVPNGMSLFDMKQAYGPLYGDIIGKAVVANQVSPGTREVYQAEAFKAKKDIATIETALDQASKMPKDMLGTRPGAIVGGLFNKWASANPQYAGLVTAVQTHNALYPADQIDPGTLSLAQIIEKLNVDRTNRTKDLSINSEAAGMQTLPTPGAPSATQGNVPSAAKPNVPTTGMVLMADKAGKRFKIPADRVDEATADGLQRVK